VALGSVASSFRALAGACVLALVWLLDARLFTAFGIKPELALPAIQVTRILAFSVPLQLFYVTCAQLLEAMQTTPRGNRHHVGRQRGEPGTEPAARPRVGRCRLGLVHGRRPRVFWRWCC